ncbi:hypothetical protein MNBD_PLANCTO02-1889 [hydrothermal vent metagenome]|uniref:FAD/NAD(P)-binding domain-containing protein n=1 Tax=hydrothermal vent metagenome TaxID=652676 RepID=A0A3B1E7Z4_9ZZZZ
MTTHRRKYDLIILGDTTEGIAAAFAAAKMSLHVALVAESKPNQHSPVLATLFHQKLALEGIDTYHEDGYFLNSNIVVAGEHLLHAEKIIIATGTISHRPASFSFDGKQVIDIDEALTMKTLPSTMVIAGDDCFGIAAANQLAKRGVDVTLIALECPQDLSANITFKQGEAIGTETTTESHVKIQLANGEEITAEMIVVNAGRLGKTDSLNLAAADLMADDCGRLWCNSDYQTWEPSIYGLGDVAGLWDKQDDLQTVIQQILTTDENEVVSRQLLAVS